MAYEHVRFSIGSITCLLVLALSVLLAACRDNSAKSERVTFFEAGTIPQGFFPRAEPEAVGIDRGALAALVSEAQHAHSNALIVIKDGRVLTERYFGHPAEHPLRINSVTKSVVSLAICRLISDGKISGLNTPLSTWFPEWRNGKKRKVTLRHIMTHTSGLYHEKNAAKLYQQPDVVRYSRGLPLVTQPGEHFSYSNEAVALLSGIVLAATGKPLDEYLQDAIFTPMGITGYKWDRDTAGNVMAYGGLWLFPRDLARIGQLMANSGRWGKVQVVPSAWICACTAPVYVF